MFELYRKLLDKMIDSRNLQTAYQAAVRKSFRAVPSLFRIPFNHNA
ncbi:MAG: hypothetical protein K2P59_00990 [Acetatifactor sp.]|nr:hypothetical protein [Acetatifactor sp.]